MFEVSKGEVAYHDRRAEEESELAEQAAAGRDSHEELARLHSLRSTLLAAALNGRAGRPIDKEA